ncbi:putative glycolipid-binding protein [Hyaloraphidium curvatum]|nr:putative glycolipid-binding protein [Hyaloraphidium curvatum]
MSILWRRLDTEGHDSARLISLGDSWRIVGTAVFLGDGGEPCRMDYEVDASPTFETRRAAVRGWVGETPVEHIISVDSERKWTLDGTAVPKCDNCVDVDLSFTPATNLLPLRRLALQQDQNVSVTAAWLTFPEFGLETLNQSYLNRGGGKFAYEAPDLDFKAELAVREDGFVSSYEGLWKEVVKGD